MYVSTRRSYTTYINARYFKSIPQRGLLKMALADSETSTNEKPVETPKPPEKREKPLTKVVVRRLPPGITQESFLSQVSPIPDYNYIYTVKGEASLGEFSFSRVYVNFCNPDDIYAFKEKFDNYVFVDTKGHEYAAVVEFASFQKVPKRRGKPRSDPKSGSIETDHLYLEFLESLKSQPNQDEKPEYSYQPTSESKNDNTTPLLDFIKQRRIDRQRIREEKKEERRKKEFERKKIKDEERRKHYEEKSPNKVISKSGPSASKSESSKEKSSGDGGGDEKIEEKPSEKSSEKSEGSFEKPPPVNTITYRNRKFEDRKTTNYKTKTKYGSRDSDYYDRRDSYKNRREEKEKEYKKKTYDEPKKEAAKESGTKKIKKYSERREELKAKQFVGKQSDTKDQPEQEGETTKKSSEPKEFDETKSRDNEDRGNRNFDEEKKGNQSPDSCGESKNCERESKHKNKENDPRLQRRIKNKDRPTMALYQPGMLRKKQEDGPEIESKPNKCSSSEKD